METARRRWEQDMGEVGHTRMAGPNGTACRTDSHPLMHLPDGSGGRRRRCAEPVSTLGQESRRCTKNERLVQDAADYLGRADFQDGRRALHHCQRRGLPPALPRGGRELTSADRSAATADLRHYECFRTSASIVIR
jgi:hypothetical protein